MEQHVFLAALLDVLDELNDQEYQYFFTTALDCKEYDFVHECLDSDRTFEDDRGIPYNFGVWLFYNYGLKGDGSLEMLEIFLERDSYWRRELLSSFDPDTRLDPLEYALIYSDDLEVLECLASCNDRWFSSGPKPAFYLDVYAACAKRHRSEEDCVERFEIIYNHGLKPGYVSLLQAVCKETGDETPEGILLWIINHRQDSTLEVDTST